MALLSHYCRHVDGYDEVEGLAVSHANFLLKSIELIFLLLIEQWSINNAMSVNKGNKIY